MLPVHVELQSSGDCVFLFIIKYYRLRITERNADVSLLSAIYVNSSYAGCMIDLNIRWPFTVLQTAIETITKKRFELVSKSLAFSSFDEVGIIFIGS